MVGIIVYALCGGAALLCTGLLLRAYYETGTRLLLWSTACFACLTLNNLLVMVDLVFFPNIDLFLLRTAAALAGVGALLFGLIWEVRR
ncbi:MAG: DUF5985 family protein [Gemmatimonadales bacterium]